MLKALKARDIDAATDNRSEKIGFKIREARLDRVPYMLVVGQQEEEEGLVSVRSRFAGDEGSQEIAGFIAQVQKEVADRVAREMKSTQE